jgi:hypothetical protein
LITSGQLTETFSGGTLIADTDGSGMGNGSGTATFTIDLRITGGTGSFEGFTGEATLTGSLTQTSATTESISNGSFTGSVTASPEPSTVLLAVGGILGFAWRRRTGRRAFGRVLRS